ncbi:hypothetical protein CCHR01_18390 [Colletotrichum chrysophilum]|uniref:Uncharacterized protein n=1 Tax=Colletotrichum chrysophilum TaxID=1836956 RepID=A0AAD9A073_9PEZI|nr:hypothetical protein CCHR01_18390 [Colletotrichum chrysophilum]
MIVDVLFGLRNLLVLVCSRCLRARRRLKIPSLLLEETFLGMYATVPHHTVGIICWSTHHFLRYG